MILINQIFLDSLEENSKYLLDLCSYGMVISIKNQDIPSLDYTSSFTFKIHILEKL